MRCDVCGDRVQIGGPDPDGELLTWGGLRHPVHDECREALAAIDASIETEDAALSTKYGSADVLHETAPPEDSRGYSYRHAAVK